ncbi:MFS transporter [Pseudonocardia benzenivorans]|jgi:MFS family permease|uniref:Major facilitator superfamily MFS_1 n=2 Tax=Pseudonocardia TaxID=1847 RepID=F4CPZ2_PSEUX|nr:MFS transporter [Pseudonocardia dioxanivorans]AEA27188.1 major facilitator superfamily MFS_1 [Pseudonocardia dioxanivorans CB1190]GJF07189.1 MFS transporter [Pseudonocardia sp. D17]
MKGRGALLLTHAVLLQATIFLVRPTISYRALDIGVSAPWLGALAACFTIAPLALALPAGRLADRRGERPVLVAGSVFAIAGCGLMLLIGQGVVGLVVASVLLGCGHLYTMLGEQSLVAARGDMVRAFGRFALAQSAGQAAGPLVVAALGGSGTHPDTTRLFVAGLVAACAMGGVTVLLRPPARTPSTEAAKAGPGALRTLLRVPDLPVAVLSSLTVIATIDLLVVYLPVLGAERGLAASTVGMLLTIRALASVVSRLLLPGGTRRLGRRGLLLASLAGSTAAVALLPAGHAIWVLVVLVVFAGFALGVGQPLTMAWVAEVAPAPLRGTALSLRLSGNRLGQTVLPAVAGLCAAGLGTAGVFWTLAASLGTTGVLAAAARGGRA